MRTLAHDEIIDSIRARMGADILSSTHGLCDKAQIRLEKAVV